MDNPTENINICLPDHINELAKSLYQLQLSNSLCDMLILGEDGDISVHSVILSATSSSFGQWISNSERTINGMISIYLKGELIQDLRNLVTFIYTGTISLSDTNIQRMIKLLLSVGMESVVKHLHEDIFPFNKRFSELFSVYPTVHNLIEKKQDIDDNEINCIDDGCGNLEHNNMNSLHMENTLSEQMIYENISELHVNNESLMSHNNMSLNLNKTSDILSLNQNNHDKLEIYNQMKLREDNLDREKDMSCSSVIIDNDGLSAGEDDENCEKEMQEQNFKEEDNVKQADIDSAIDSLKLEFTNNDVDTIYCKLCNIDFVSNSDYEKHYKDKHSREDEDKKSNTRKRKKDQDNEAKVEEKRFSLRQKPMTRSTSKSGKNLVQPPLFHKKRKVNKRLANKRNAGKIKLPDKSLNNDALIEKESEKESNTGANYLTSSHLHKVKNKSAEMKLTHKNTKEITNIAKRKFGKGKTSLKNNKKKKSARTFCILCNERFTDHESYLTHRKEKHTNIHREMNERKTTHICNYEGCDYKTKNKGFMARHKDLVHGEEVDDTKINIFRCEVDGCNYYHVQKSRIIVHMKDHSQAVEVICDICGKGFKHKKALIVHKKSHIPKEERNYKYSCPMCDKKFYIKGSLTTHLKLHQDHKYLCHLCPYSSNALSRRHLDIHLFKVHQIPLPDNRPIFRCTQCDYYTFYKGVFNSHLSKHSGEKFDCEICGKSFSSQMNLSQHVRRHKAEKIKCPFDGCTYYGRKEDMRDHTQSMHTFKNVKPFTCHLCEYRCNLQGNLTKHLRGKHKLDVETTSTLWRKLMETGQGYDAIFDQNRTFAMEKVERTPVTQNKDLAMEGVLPSIREIVSIVTDSFVPTDELHSG